MARILCAARRFCVGAFRKDHGAADERRLTRIGRGAPGGGLLAEPNCAIWVRFVTLACRGVRLLWWRSSLWRCMALHRAASLCRASETRGHAASSCITLQPVALRQYCSWAVDRRAVGRTAELALNLVFVLRHFETVPWHSPMICGEGALGRVVPNCAWARRGRTIPISRKWLA